MTVIQLNLSGREFAETKRRARALRHQVADAPPRGKVAIATTTLDRLLRFVDAASNGDAVAPHQVARPPERQDDEISPQDAATILGMSRPSVMRLIAGGHLHARKILTRNKLSRADVVAFAKRDNRRREQALRRLSALSEEYDF